MDKNMEKLHSSNKICHFKDILPITLRLRESLFHISFIIKDNLVMISFRVKAKLLI